MKKIKSILLLGSLVTVGLTVFAQQAPMYTHYMYNTLSVNPAYAGSRDALTITGLHRSQWTDFDGAPETQTITIHTPVFNEHIGVGLTVLNDKIGPTKNTAISGSFAYRMQLTKKAKLALGLNAGASIFRADLSTVQLDNQNDPSFQNNTSNNTSPNIGFGVYYAQERFYAGISAPNLIENKFAETNSSDFEGAEQRHYFFIAGAMIRISNKLDFKPTTLIKVTSSAPIQADFTASLVIAKKLAIGGMFRTGDAAGILVGYNIFEQLLLGYSFDWSYGLETGTYNNGSHEIMLRYDFIYPSQKQIHSPRYF